MIMMIMIMMMIKKIIIIILYSTFQRSYKVPCKQAKQCKTVEKELHYTLHSTFTWHVIGEKFKESIWMQLQREIKQ